MDALRAIGRKPMACEPSPFDFTEEERFQMFKAVMHGNVGLLPEGSGGEVSHCLEELCDCGFLRRYNMPGTLKKGAIYQHIDNYALFYFNFLRNRKGTDDRF